MKSKAKPKSDCERRPAAIKAAITFELPEAEEFLELAVQSRKWRQVVQDLALIICEWRDMARTSAEADAYKSVNLILRDYLAESGLTLYPREHLAQMRDERQERYRKHVGELFRKGPERWRDIMGKVQKGHEEQK